MLLSGCSNEHLAKACPVQPIVPKALLLPHDPPLFNVTKWGDYPGYVEELNLSLARCNADKTAVAQIMSPQKG
ncbi:Rz1-like lysis system protein LysC [Yersinia sp. J1]|uniref:Rz1-like lysis system protein LysC n=1 Tax=Yersinia TaxID=629 RepID=UPI003B838AA4